MNINLYLCESFLKFLRPIYINIHPQIRACLMNKERSERTFETDELDACRGGFDYFFYMYVQHFSRNISTYSVLKK